MHCSVKIDDDQELLSWGISHNKACLRWGRCSAFVQYEQRWHLRATFVKVYFPARRFSQAQAAARVSSIGRSALQPSSRLARDGSAQMAVTSPARRGAIRQFSWTPVAFRKAFWTSGKTLRFGHGFFGTGRERKHVSGRLLRDMLLKNFSKHGNAIAPCTAVQGSFVL